MRKFFYCISVFLFLCILSAGYYGSYKYGDKKREVQYEQLSGESEAKAAGLQDEKDGYGLFFLKEEKGVVMVYESDRTTLYEPTTIKLSALPETLQREIAAGKYIKTQRELYSFLENYSS